MDTITTEDPIAGIATYSDGSGNALENEARNLEHLAKERADLNALEAFIAKHRERLAGSSWDVQLFSHFGKPMGVHFSNSMLSYRGKRMTPTEFIMAVWPDLDWKRVDHFWSMSDEYRDYAVETEGIELRIMRAEYSKPVKASSHKSNGRLRLPKSPTTSTP